MSKTWKIAFCLTIDATWIEDGFDMTPALLREIIHDGILDYAYDEEKRVTNIVIREVPEKLAKTRAEGSNP
jgi:hypothetical protein